mmetsp:Transcript_73423/g.212666  ORF Transcript_73423/g.212666 Transcript_73423/m.212666 type:complete len:241 (-) Transcript_73423:69-791(-)
MTSIGSPPFRVSTSAPILANFCFSSRDRISSFWAISEAAVAACWPSSAALAAISASPVSMASWAATAARAAAAAASAATLAAVWACALAPRRSKTREGFLPSAFQNFSISTPLGRFGSSLLSGKSSKSVASITKIRSTPGGRVSPWVASHFKPLSRAATLLSSPGPLLPGCGKVATTASTCSYHGIMGLAFMLSWNSSSSNSRARISSSSLSSSKNMSSSSSSSSISDSAQMTSGGGAIS